VDNLTPLAGVVALNQMLAMAKRLSTVDKVRLIDWLAPKIEQDLNKWARLFTGRSMVYWLIWDRRVQLEPGVLRNAESLSH